MTFPFLVSNFERCTLNLLLALSSQALRVLFTRALVAGRALRERARAARRHGNQIALSACRLGILPDFRGGGVREGVVIGEIVVLEDLRLDSAAREQEKRDE